MNSFWRIFSLELIGFIRSKTLAMLTVVSIVWMFALPRLVHSDGTAEGLRELDVRYSLGGVLVLLVISLLASATGSLARERAEKRLQLTLVRPVRYAAIVLAKALAHVVVGAAVLAVAVVILACRADCARPCAHVLKPLLPSPREEAKEMYAAFMADPETPPAVKRTKKAIVLRLLENKALDHYQTIPTNATLTWTFADPALATAEGLSVRMRFSTAFNSREEVRGVFTIGDWTASVSNITQAILTVPLAREFRFGTGYKPMTPDSKLAFHNQGRNPLMLRPRKDIDLLLPADSFAANLLRSYVLLVVTLALVVAFGLFLSASLGRPVALFVAIVTVLVGEMSPSVIEQYPDELETKLSDRIGLVLTRFAAEVTRPVTTLNPLERLSLDECVEPSTVLRAVAFDGLLLPVVLAVLAGFVLPRKQEDQ